MAARRRVKTEVVAPVLRLKPSAIVPWAAVLGLVALVLGGLAVQAGAVLLPLYPLAALTVGALLYWRYPALYLGFTWWVWFLTPEVRRLVDYQQGWNPLSFVMLAPYLVTAITFFTLLRHLPKLQLSRFFPFGLILLGLLYGYSVGVYRAGPSTATFDLLSWLVPVVFAFHLLVHWRNYLHYRRVVQHTFLWGVLVLGLYGLLQYFMLPAWDQYWMVNATDEGLTSIGLPEAFEVRVFSTLNSPYPFALVMMAGLLLLLSGEGVSRWLWVLRWPAAGVGYASFLLSLVRAAWGGWVVGLLFIVAQGGRFRPRLLASLAVIGLITVPLLNVGPVADTVNVRLQTITEPQRDISFNERLAFYSEFAPQAFLNPVGEGLGSTGVATKLSTLGGQLGRFANFDSGLMNVPFVLGWPGSLLYISGLAWLLFYALRGGGSRSDLFAATSRGIVVALLTLLIFANTLTGVTGMLFWTFLSLSLAARAYYAENTRRLSKRPFGFPR